MIRRVESGRHWREFKEINNELMTRWDNCLNWIKEVFFGTVDEGINFYVIHGWKEVTQSGYDPNDIQAQYASLWGGKPCCGGGTNGGMYNKGAWHDLTCDSLKAPPTQSYLPGYTAPAIPQPTNLGRCTCGSSSVGSDRHSDYCDLYRK